MLFGRGTKGSIVIGHVREAGVREAALRIVGVTLKALFTFQVDSH